MITYRRMNSRYEWIDVTQSEYDNGIEGDKDAPNNRGAIYANPEGVKFITLDVANISPSELSAFTRTVTGSRA